MYTKIPEFYTAILVHRLGASTWVCHSGCVGPDPVVPHRRPLAHHHSCSHSCSPPPCHLPVVPFVVVIIVVALHMVFVGPSLVSSPSSCHSCPCSSGWRCHGGSRHRWWWWSPCCCLPLLPSLRLVPCCPAWSSSLSLFAVLVILVWCWVGVVIPSTLSSIVSNTFFRPRPCPCPCCCCHPPHH
jgi:hypothetical protein